MAIDSMTVENSKEFYISVDHDKKVILVLSVRLPFLALKFYIFVKQKLLVVSLKMILYVICL